VNQIANINQAKRSRRKC